MRENFKRHAKLLALGLIDENGYYTKRWTTLWDKYEAELSDSQSMFCICGRLATGLHEQSCNRFKTAVEKKIIEAVKAEAL
jgi:hypothetical protein